MMQRRKFLTYSVLGSLVAAVGAGSWTGVFSGENTVSLESLKANVFAGLLGQRFQVSGSDSSTQSVVLAQVQEYNRGPRIENYSLYFKGESEAALPQGVYHFSHSQLGKVELFVVAKPHGDDHCGYEAVINRLS